MVAGLTLAGCAGSRARMRTGDVELTVQAWADTTQAKVYEEVFDVFEEKNPGVTVKLDWMDVGSYQDKLARSSPPEARRTSCSSSDCGSPSTPHAAHSPT